MGLDVSAYKGLRLIGTAKNDEEYEDNYDWETTTWVYPGNVENPSFPEQLNGSELVAGGVYEYKEVVSFRAGSYSGYNHWRNELSMLMFGVPAQTVWKRSKAYRGSSFFFLINFSDCEGIIAGRAVEKLKHDFETWQKEVDSHDNPSFRKLYTEWRKAFELAADGGMVRFH